MARREGILAKQDKRSTQREVTHIYFKFLLSLNSIYMSIEICNGCDFTYLFM